MKKVLIGSTAPGAAALGLALPSPILNVNQRFCSGRGYTESV